MRECAEQENLHLGSLFETSSSLSNGRSIKSPRVASLVYLDTNRLVGMSWHLLPTARNCGLFSAEHNCTHTSARKIALVLLGNNSFSLNLLRQYSFLHVSLTASNPMPWWCLISSPNLKIQPFTIPPYLSYAALEPTRRRAIWQSHPIPLGRTRQSPLHATPGARPSDTMRNARKREH